MNKRYKLLKDSIELKKDDIFISKGSGGGHHYVLETNDTISLMPRLVENNPDWFSPLPSEPIQEDKPFTSLWYTGRKEANYVFNNPVDTPTKEKIDNAILNVLNGEDKGWGEWHTISQVSKEPFIQLSKSQLDGMMENVFNAARETDLSLGSWLGHLQMKEKATLIYKTKYATFDDYRKSLPENNQQPTPEQPKQQDVLFTTEDGVEYRYMKCTMR